MAATDPDEIQREIERTRAELAETIDAIAEKVSPKRALTRTVGRVRTAVQGDQPRIDVDVPETGERVGLVAGHAAGPPTTAVDRHEAYARDTRVPGGAHAGSVHTVRRRLRVDRVVIVAGVAVAVVVVVVLARRGDGYGDLDDFDF